MSAIRILVVEDDLDIRESLRDALADEGYSVASAVDGVDALDQLVKDEILPKLILLDLMMPRMNGVQFHGEISKVEAWTKIPVVIISADAHARARADAIGAAAYLKKPVRLDDLFRTVAQLVA